MFFYCNFPSQCWQKLVCNFDMRYVKSGPSWMLQKLSTGDSEEIIKIATRLWGIWNVQNKKLWENKNLTPYLALEWSSKQVSEWPEVRRNLRSLQSNIESLDRSERKRWGAPTEGEFKLNVMLQ